MSAVGAQVVVAVVQVVVLVLAAPVVVGVTREVRARAEGRAGGRVGQPWRDLVKWWRKRPLQATGTSVVSRIAPVLLLSSSLVVVALVPLVTAAPTVVPADLLVVVSVLLVGTVAIALLGLDAGSAFGGMGSSRHMMIAALVEPTVLMAVYALSVPVGSSSLSAIVDARRDDPASIASPAGVLAVVALVVVVLAETGRLPVDNPSTHLELTMVHEAMLLEASGRDLASLELGGWLRLSALLGLVGNLVLPWGVAGGTGPGELALGAVALLAKLGLLAAVLGAAEVGVAKLRLFRVPELLAGSFVLAFLAVTASALVA
ncbi:NADH-quinone oxidoreductase subunit H [Actinotalea sp. M2MS4P-6]|uniref:respiratory chain complex I subunit 1 family protein n=1 Tax=Actinotalea sp. M2MS4P-6 TaxID=2983762 RepID=UPI0021E50940|nr:NADH-quinone oxidoreductase subunit H [Actinotalea sp. M2MS4P-6]MCV2395702.1 NADH-quinone oxidoreductase subunit H [Actinotalea sp. M2MS4P-6]